MGFNEWTGIVAAGDRSDQLSRHVLLAASFTLRGPRRTPISHCLSSLATATYAPTCLQLLARGNLLSSCQPCIPNTGYLSPFTVPLSRYYRCAHQQVSRCQP